MVGGSATRSNSWVHAWCQGEWLGRCRVIRRAEDATRAGMLISLRRTVEMCIRDRLQAGQP